ncbi:MAG: hypothetical protein KDA61_13915, partial [Planctomycetales bacterium]|nr:hypothetical protein [Planctomycetales bacterium]
MKRLFLFALAASLGFVPLQQGRAQNLLSGGDFEAVDAPDIPGWTVNEFASGTNIFVDSVVQNGFSPFSGDYVVWVRPFVGGIDPGPNNLTNAELSQVVPVTAGQSYTFSGYSRWESNYSGGVDLLDPVGPLGEVASPTQTVMEIEWLDGSGAAIGTPLSLDLRTEQININLWGDAIGDSHKLTGTAPAGAVSARVLAANRDMVWNTFAGDTDGPSQSAFWDTFSFTSASDPSTEILANPDFEEARDPLAGFEAWDLFTEDPGNPENDELFRPAGFANHTTGGSQGVWVSSFFGEVDTPVDATISQTVAAVPGGEYTFSGWARWEQNYAGGVDTIGAGNTKGDEGKPSPTETYMELAFLDGSGEVIGDPILLDLRTVQTNDNEWHQHMLSGTAPSNVVSVRASASVIDAVYNQDPQQSAFWDDFELTLA